MSLINGWLILNKPSGISSCKLLGAAKRLLKVQKAGHLGTLDPQAEGVLPIALGEATKAINFIKNETKGYEFKLKFGIETSSGDLEGEIIRETTTVPTKENIEAILVRFIGKIEQYPPIYSAIKINGERAYKLARKQIKIDMPRREVLIHKLILRSYDEQQKEAFFYVLCEKGTYVRSLGVDMAKALGSAGCITHINRVQSGDFFIKDAIMLDNLEKMMHNNELNKCIKAVEFVLDDIPVVKLTTQTQQKVRNGLSISIDKQNCTNLIYKAVYQEKLVAIGYLNSGFFKPKRVFNI